MKCWIILGTIFFGCASAPSERHLASTPLSYDLHEKIYEDFLTGQEESLSEARWQKTGNAQCEWRDLAKSTSVVCRATEHSPLVRGVLAREIYAILAHTGYEEEEDGRSRVISGELSCLKIAEEKNAQAPNGYLFSCVR